MFRPFILPAFLGTLLPLSGLALPDEMDEILEFYCYDCHGYGKKEGGIKLDELSLKDDHGDLWERIWRNVRTGMMPPAEGDPLDADEKKELLDWLERNPLNIDRNNPDPGRVTVRRHNRSEYQATIKDLLGLDFDTAEHFPPDDTGYGFDTIGDVLTISPLLAERYFESAKSLMAQAVTDNAASFPELSISAPDFIDLNNPKDTGRFIEFNRPQTVTAKRRLKQAGDYEVTLTCAVEGSSEATDQTATLIMAVDGKELARKDLGWDFSKGLELKARTQLDASEHTFTLQLIAGEKPKPGQGELGVAVSSVNISGPMGSQSREYPLSYRYVIASRHQPQHKEEWPVKMKAAISAFGERAWRRPLPKDSLNKLTDLALEAARREGTFEAGIRQAGTAILASPRFLLRTETAQDKKPNDSYPLIDDWSLASRLSYFLWNSLPDDELRSLAAAGDLRANLSQQIERMLQDAKSERFVGNFVGQWLQARDVESQGMRPEVILGIRFSAGQRLFNSRLRQNMREETEALFRHILEERKAAVELISADYTFLNERLADFYQIQGVQGENLRKVQVPNNRGGLLTQGTFLVVTSNPTRTSPVKRGLFVLDNLLGTPPPPAPPDIPELEQAGHGKKNLTMKERMVEHRKNPDCRSCHQRMDPIGLAFENFTAIGTYRDEEDGQAIETEGELVTGEKFASVADLKRVLATDRKGDFHRCLAEKLLTYALGRGIEYYDAPAIDEIVARMESNNGTLHEAIYAVIESVPFQRRRP